MAMENGNGERRNDFGILIDECGDAIGDEIREQEQSRLSNYRIVTIPLDVARADVEISVAGSLIYVQEITGSASVRLSESKNSLLSLNRYGQIQTAFTRLFLTNTAQADRKVILLIADDASFSAATDPLAPRVASAYKYQSFDLNTVRANVDISAIMGIDNNNPGLGFTVVSLDGVATLRLGTDADDLIDLETGLALNDFSFPALFLTNAQQPGLTLKLFVPR